MSKYGFNNTIMHPRDVATEPRVLVVDDDPVFISIVEGCLEDSEPQLEIVVATNGQEAVSILDNRRIDLLLTDIQMPVMDGFQLLAHVANRRFEIPVLVATAHLSPDMESKLQRDGGYCLLDKPIDVEYLRELVMRLLFEDKEGRLVGFTIAGILQLVEIERKSCTVTVRHQAVDGFLQFDSGVLLGAASGDLVGDAAAIEIFGWRDVEVVIGPPMESRGKKVTMSLTHLLLESARLRDEDIASDLPTEIDHTTIDIAGGHHSLEVDEMEQTLLSKAVNIAGTHSAMLFSDDGALLANTGDPQPIGITESIGDLVRAASAATRGFENEDQTLDEILVGSRNRWLLIHPASTTRFIALVLERAAGNPVLVKHQLRALVSAKPR